MRRKTRFLLVIPRRDTLTCAPGGKEGLFLPGAEEEPTKGSEEEASLEARVHEIHLLEPLPHRRRHRLVHRPQRRHPGKIIRPLNISVNINHAERPPPELRKYPPLQIPLQRLLSQRPAQLPRCNKSTAMKSSYINFPDPNFPRKRSTNEVGCSNLERTCRRCGGSGGRACHGPGS